MAIKRRIVGPTTGIYTSFVTASDNPDPDEALKEFFEHVNKGFDLDGQLTAIERIAKGVLRDHGLSEDWREAGDWQKLPPAARDACRVLTDLLILRDHLASGDLKLSIIFALKLGRRVERLMVRPAEPLALSGRKTSAGGRKGHLKTYGTEEERKAAWRGMKTVFEEIYKNHSDRGKTWCVEKAVRKYGISKATFYNWKKEFQK